VCVRLTGSAKVFAVDDIDAVDFEGGAAVESTTTVKFKDGKRGGRRRSISLNIKKEKVRNKVSKKKAVDMTSTAMAPGQGALGKIGQAKLLPQLQSQPQPQQTAKFVTFTAQAAEQSKARTQEHRHAERQKRLTKTVKLDDI
jgi:hypothetical protein